MATGRNSGAVSENIDGVVWNDSKPNRLKNRLLHRTNSPLTDIKMMPIGAASNAVEYMSEEKPRGTWTWTTCV